MRLPFSFGKLYKTTGVELDLLWEPKTTKEIY